MSFRVEQKIPMTFNDSQEFLEYLKVEGIENLYPKRVIKSKYFDSYDFSMYRDSEEGLLPRKKIRFRKYPYSTKSSYSLEIKISSVEGRYKTSKKISDCESRDYFKNGYHDNVYGLVEEKVCVEYLREYFLFKGIRITRDTEISYMDLFNRSKVYSEKDVVVEIKAPENAPADFLLKIIPSKRRRFSKYCNAIKSLNLA
jgi:hypothetical protein